MKRKVKDLQPGDKVSGREASSDRVVANTKPCEVLPGCIEVHFESGKVEMVLGDIEWEVVRPRRR